MGQAVAMELDPVDRALRRELYLAALYRVLEAGLLALMVFGPAGTLIGEPRLPMLAQGLAIAYLPVSFVLLAYSQRDRFSLRANACVGLACDIVVAALATHAMPAAGPGIAMLLLFNVGAAGLQLPIGLGLAGAGIAAAALFAQYLWDQVAYPGAYERPLAEIVMFAISYFAIATLTNFLGRDMRASRTLAEERGEEAANLAEINELVIRRMRTGVLMVDGAGAIRMANEAALLLLGDGGADEGGQLRTLPQISPQLAMRVAEWRRTAHQDDTAMEVGEDRIEVLPRFARLLATDDTTLIFLDDTSMVSRRAESLTLAAMGRFSASLAHEIRNPLAAISYATQLLEESTEINDSDRRLLQIIHQQCLRTNGIVESVLGLARRERATPEHIELVGFIRHFISEHRQTVPEENGSLAQAGRQHPLQAMFDPKHLQQVLSALVHNAIHYGHLPGESARITLTVEERDGVPVLEISDRGPGIPDAVTPQLFRPFFTTSEHGTGLGLYIARELCRANSAGLEYVPVPAGGACFRITLNARNPLRAI